MMYSAAVEEYFCNLAHAVDTGAPGELQTEEFEDRASGCAVRFELVAHECGALDCRFEARGCPHLLAACELSCRRIESGAQWPDCDELMETFCVPIEKTGRILLIGSALSELRSGLNKSLQSSI